MIALKARQIAAANALHAEEYTPRWLRSGEALDLLAIVAPGFDEASTLLKVSALRQLYNAGLYKTVAFEGMVDRIVKVMGDAPNDPRETVNAVAALPDGTYHYVFASKFVHFFMGPPYGQVPMLDRKWVTRRTNYHFRPPELMNYSHDSYDDFYCEALDLQASAVDGETPSFRQLDHYLWLAGMRAAWPSLPYSIHPEFVGLFGAPPPEAVPLLAALLDS